MSNRKNTIILREFEKHFILLSFITVITALLLLVALIIGIVWLIDPVLLGENGLQQALYVGAAALVLLAITYYYTMRINHRVSGPIFVLMRNLERLGEGDLTTEMRLRHQDHLQEIIGSFNRNIGQLRSEIETIKAVASAIGSANKQDEIQPLLDKLNKKLSKIKTG